MKLRELIVDTKTVWVPFEGINGFEVELAYIPRTEMSKLVKECQIQKMSRVSRQIETELDQEKFLSKFVDRAIKDWRGLKVKHLPEFMPVEFDESQEEVEVSFDKDNALFLLKQSQLFDDWVNDKINDIDTFRK